MTLILMTFKILFTNQISIISKLKSQKNNNRTKLLLPSLKMMTILSSWSLKNREMMIIMNSSISSKDKDSKLNMKTNMMIWLIITKGHCLWTQHPAIHKVKRKSKCNAWCQMKIIKKQTNLNTSSLRKNKRRLKNKINTPKSPKSKRKA